MHRIKSTVLLMIAICFSGGMFGQESAKEDGYTIQYNGRDIELVFDTPVTVKASNALSHEQIALHRANGKANAFVWNNAAPAQIIKLEYSELNGDGILHTSYVASKSMSTGAIAVYFNHPVNTAFAQTQNAVNLSNTLDDKLIGYINACTSKLDIAIYNSASPSSTAGIAGAINAAYARGVQVRLIYDGGTSSSMIPLLDSGIPVLASPGGVNYGIMHNKFVVFDANSTDANKPYVWTGSTNWTVSQIDGPDKNSAIMIQDQSLALGYTMEFEEMWGGSGMVPDMALSKFGPDKTNNTPHTYSIGGKTVNSYFSPSDGTTAKIIAAINTANSDIAIATMLITRNDIKNALLAKFSAGMTNINLVLDSQNPSGNQLGALQAGMNASQVVSYTGSGIMHHKFMVVDNFDSTSDPLVLVGSHNWSSSAETRNDENILIVHDANIANQYYQAFAYLYQLSGGVLEVPATPIENGLLLYPNPTKGVVHINWKGTTTMANASVAVYDLLGHVVLQKELLGGAGEQIDLEAQPAGMYFIKVGYNGAAVHYKVVKN